MLGNGVDLISPDEKSALATTLIAGLSDPNVHVRQFVARPLLDLGLPEGEAALVRALKGPDVTDLFFFRATGRARPAREPRTSSFPPTVPIADLAPQLAASDSDQRLAIAQLFARALQQNPPQLSQEDRRRIIAGLIGRLTDPNVDVRRWAAEALGAARAANAVSALTASLDGRDVPLGYASTVTRALISIGSQEALPTLERLARSAGTQQLRDEAAFAFIAIAKPADPGAEARRLLWEEPDTDLEREVLARGRPALPRAWQALANGTNRDRRAAAALLGWFPDARSIRPIVAALEQSPGALTRDQLLFDLNVILLAEGARADVDQRNELAAAHLRWMYDLLANEPTSSYIRSGVFGQTTIAVFPDRIAEPFSVELATQTAGTDPGQPRAEFSATAVRSQSAAAFLEWVTKGGCGVAFHESAWPTVLHESVPRCTCLVAGLPIRCGLVSTTTKAGVGCRSKFRLIRFCTTGW